MILFKLGSILFRSGVKAVTPFNAKAKLAIKGRKNCFQKLTSFREHHPTEKVVWFHCASYGEFEQGRPLIEAYKVKNPAQKIVLTFFSPSGYEANKNYKEADLILYLPFDGKRNAKKFIEILRPSRAFFIKYEFWPFYLDQLQKHNIETYLVSGILRKNHIIFKAPFGTKLLKAFTQFFMQDEASCNHLKNAGFTNYIVSGDSRLDRVLQNAKSDFKNQTLKSFCKENKVIIAGSTWEKDQELLIDFIQKNKDWKLVLVPHELAVEKLSKLRNQLSRVKYCFYSEIQEEDISINQIIVLNTMGMLSKVYRFGSICYVGGGFGKGIHNVLEPISYIKPVIIGPNYKKFKEALDLIQIGAVKSIINSFELDKSIENFRDKEVLISVENSINTYIENNKGSVKKILDFININA